MKRFLNGTEQAYAQLEQQARRAAYVQFANLELPPNTVPNRTRIGFKVDPSTGAAALLVGLGVRYYGGNATIRRWFEDGQLVFSNFTELRNWICCELKDEFTKPAEAITASPPEALIPQAEPIAPNQSASCAQQVPTTEHAPVDSLATDLVQLFIKQIGRKHGLDVQTIEPTLLSAFCDRMRGSNGKDFQTILEQNLEKPLAQAAAQGRANGRSLVALRAGPPVHCEFLPASGSGDEA